MDIGEKGVDRLRDWQLQAVDECQEDHGHVEEEHSREVGSTGLTCLPTILTGPHALQNPDN